MAMASTKYDIIIVGCGNAGSVLAARLSEILSLHVLVLEAGGDHAANPMLHTPAGGAALWSDASINWGFKTVPQVRLSSSHLASPPFHWQLFRLFPPPEVFQKKKKNSSL